MGGAHSRVEANITSPTSPPYVTKQLTALFHTQSLLSVLLYCSVVPSIDCAFQLKPSPALEAPGHGHLLGLAYNRKTWGYPMSTVLVTVIFLLLLDTSLLSQAGSAHYLQLLTLQHSTKLLFFSCFFKLLYKTYLQISDYHMKASARPHLLRTVNGYTLPKPTVR